MSDENVGGLVAKWRGMVDENRRKPFRTAAEGVMCDTLNDCADELEAALSAHGHPVVDAYLIERVLNTRVPGGSLVWWSINGGGMGIDDGHRNVVRRVLEAYLSMKGATP